MKRILFLILASCISACNGLNNDLYIHEENYYKDSKIGICYTIVYVDDVRQFVVTVPCDSLKNVTVKECQH